MAKLSKSNKYAILWLSSQGYDTTSIEQELKLSVKQIESVINENKQNVNTPTQVQNKTAKDFMIRHSQNNVNNVSIMTQQASMMSDEARKNHTTTNTTSQFYIKKT